MKIKALLFFLSCISFFAKAQENVFWRPISEASHILLNQNSTLSSNENFYELNTKDFQSKLALITVSTEDKAKEIISFPNATGAIEQFVVWESSNFDPALQAKYPNIQSFSGRGISDPNARVYFSFSDAGINTMILRSNGKPAEFMDPIKGNKGKYVVYQSDKNAKGVLPIHCTTEEKNIASNVVSKSSALKISDRVFRKFHLALSCTGEYAAYHGGSVQSALAAMNVTMTRVNGVFNRDLALKLELIAENDKVIFTNAATDPYATVVNEEAPSSWSQELENTLSGNLLGASKYDIGHLFGASGGGGNAGCIGCVCDSNKARAYTSPSNNKPEGDTFDIDFVAHEFGHQLGATHTFSYASEDTGTNVEPGSGSTIMGYAGLTDYDIQSNSDDYFAFVSIDQIQKNLATKNCPFPTPITSAVFGVNAGPDYTIPKSTPFVLKGLTTGTHTTAFNYVWEQNDSATQLSIGANSLAIADKIDGPLFRSIPPSGSLTRYFPSFNSVLANRLTNSWESLSSIGRTLTFVLTARDNATLGNGQTASDVVLITVSNTAGPFEVTSQATTDLSWIQGSSQAITWKVNNTNLLAGANTVNIKLSTDGGQTFPIILASNTPNDGSETIVVPAVTSLTSRILIEPTQSIFYAVNAIPFTIGYTTVSTCSTYPFSTPIVIPDGDSNFTTKQIVVPADLGAITDVNVDVSLAHNYLSDIELELVSPQNTKVRLLQRVCGSSKTPLVLKLDDNGNRLDCIKETLQVVIPTDLLSGFNTQNPEGTWTLRVRDNFSTDSGVINAASVTICTQKATLDTKDISFEDFKIFPNPSSGLFTVAFSTLTDLPVNILVSDVLGRKVFQKQFESSSNFNQKIDLKQTAKGVYFLNVTQGDRKEVKKIVIQ